MVYSACSMINPEVAPPIMNRPSYVKHSVIKCLTDLPIGKSNGRCSLFPDGSGLHQVTHNSNNNNSKSNGTIVSIPHCLPPTPLIYPSNFISFYFCLVLLFNHLLSPISTSYMNVGIGLSPETRAAQIIS